MATTYLQELAASHSQQKTNKFRTSVTDAWTVRQPGARSDHTVLAAVLVDNMANERTAHAISESVALRIRVALDDASPSAAVLSPADRAERALKAANYDLFYRAANENKRETLGASVMVALLTKTGEQVTLQLLHVGNGRAYLVRGAELRPLTTEHTVRQAQRELDPHANARDDDPRWDRPLRYLGAEAEVTIERTAPFAIEREDRIILVAAQVRPTVVKHAAETVRRRSSNAAVNALIKRAAAYRPADPLTTPPITDCAAVVIARHQVNPLRQRLVMMIMLCSLALLLAVWFFPALIQLLPKEPTQTSTQTPAQPPEEEALQATAQPSAGEETSKPITPTQQLTSAEDTDLIPPTLPATTTLTVTARTPVTPSVTGQVAISTTSVTPNGTVTPTVNAQSVTSTTVAVLEAITKTLTPQPADQLSPVVLTTPYPVTDTPIPPPTPIATATGTATPTPVATLTNTPTAQPTALPTATPTVTSSSVATATLKPGPQPLARSNEEYSYPAGAKGAITFNWSATRDVNANEVYHFEIFDHKNDNRIVHSNDPVLRQLAQEDDAVDISVLQGKDWLSWHVRTGVIEDGKFRATSEWSKRMEFKVTVKTEANNPSKPEPTPTPR